MIENKDIFPHQSRISAAQREERNGHKGCVVWLTGLSAAGKSTIATELEARLFDMGIRSYVLDGDNLRHGLCSDLGFSEHDRTENIRRIGRVAALFADAGFVSIVAAISPYRAGRQAVRELLPAGRFIEVHVHAPLEVLEHRDYKGLYARARARNLGQFTGISAPYEAPLAPELDLATDQLSVTQSVGRILELIKSTACVKIPLPVLRPEEPADEPFLFTVYASTRQEELDATGWPPEVRNTFLSMQFKAMRQGYRTAFPRADYSIILLNGQPAGRMVVNHDEQEIRLVDIALLPALRSQGAGTLLIRRLLAEAQTAKKTVVLQVMTQNSAARLYQRLGFQFTEKSDLYNTMRWPGCSPL